MIQFGPSALLVVPLGIYLMLKRSNKLVLFFIFSIPFSATSILNIGTNADGKAITPAIFLALLIILKAGFDLAANSGRLRTGANHMTYIMIAAYVLACVASIMSMTLNSGAAFNNVSARGLGGATAVFVDHVSIGVRQFTQLAYQLVWLLVSVSIAHLAKHKIETYSYIKAIIISAIAMSLLGFWQILHVLYPSWLLDNTANPFGHGSGQTIVGLALHRMASAAVEPSVLAAFLLFAVGMWLFLVAGRYYIFGKIADILGIAFLLITLGATTSTTAFVGFLVLFVLLLIVIRKHRKIDKNYMLLSVVFFVIASALLYFTDDIAVPVFTHYVIDKTDSFSFLQRVNSINVANQDFLSFPMFGVGIGTVTSYSLPFWLLANIGLFGFVAFALLAVAAVRSLRPRDFDRIALDRYAEYATLRTALQYSFVLSLIIAMLSGPAIWFPYFWLPIMLILVTSKLRNEIVGYAVAPRNMTP